MLYGFYRPGRGRDHPRRRAVDFHSPADARQPRHRHGVPELHPDPGADRAGEHRPADPEPAAFSIDAAALTQTYTRSYRRATASKSTRPRTCATSRSASSSGSRSSRCWPATPRILILDEPTSVLAPHEVEACSTIVRKPARRRLRGDPDHPQAGRGLRLRRPRQRPATRHRRRQRRHLPTSTSDRC